MNPQCARCGKVVYPTEKVNCLDKYWHKGCFHCEVCKMALNMNNYKGYEKKPYCNASFQVKLGLYLSLISRVRHIQNGASVPGECGLQITVRRAELTQCLATSERSDYKSLCASCLTLLQRYCGRFEHGSSVQQVGAALAVAQGLLFVVASRC
ncbi:hypothetical protein MJG53_011542 [Ovis ammon polii x Ovis aries]|uniref:Uncharacterized protein n=1 Tax=Ovis ammon polii x Ovis aries TaxID=2918886 RepID=A0ACB9UPM6_9CETA|nr:hypothetical protein MJG53_011542 [Ovis ammon polii x Ovis aries]